MISGGKMVVLVSALAHIIASHLKTKMVFTSKLKLFIRRWTLNFDFADYFL